MRRGDGMRAAVQRHREVVTEAGQGGHESAQEGGDACPEGDVVPHVIAAGAEIDDVGEGPAEEPDGYGDEGRVQRVTHDRELAAHFGAPSVPPFSLTIRARMRRFASPSRCGGLARDGELTLGPGN